MQTATSETESMSLDPSICVHHYISRAPCPKGQGIPKIAYFPRVWPTFCGRGKRAASVHTRGSHNAWRLRILSLIVAALMASDWLTGVTGNSQKSLGSVNQWRLPSGHCSERAFNLLPHFLHTVRQHKAGSCTAPQIFR